MTVSPTSIGRLLGGSLLILCQIGCLGRVSLAPHLNREADLAPSAAAGRYGTVLERAAAFEKQNQTSRDVHWYKTWRAVAMVGLGQHEQATALLDQVLADVSAAKVGPAQPDRLRQFIYDLKAQSARAQGDPRTALDLMDRAYTIAERVELELGGECDRALVMAGRLQAIEDVATEAGALPRAAQAHEQMKTRVAAWAKCLRMRDYPATAGLPALVAALERADRPISQVIPPTNKPMPPPLDQPAPPPPPAVAAPPPPPPAQPSAPTLQSLPVAAGKYAPVSAKPWRAGLDSVRPLLAKRAPGAKTAMLIRTDGRHHALRITLAKPVRNLAALAPIFRSTVVFFESTRAVKPVAEHVVVVSGGVSVLADKSAVMDLFLDRVDATGFSARLSKLP